MGEYIESIAVTEVHYKSPGPDGINPSDRLKTLFELTFKEGKMLTDWKDVEVRPIFKKEDKNIVGTYRPLSLTYVVCKDFEGFIHDALGDHRIKYSDSVGRN